jgi:hypothetical protein
LRHKGEQKRPTEFTNICGGMLNYNEEKQGKRRRKKREGKKNQYLYKFINTTEEERKKKHKIFVSSIPCDGNTPFQ